MIKIGEVIKYEPDRVRVERLNVGFVVGKTVAAVLAEFVGDGMSSTNKLNYFLVMDDQGFLRVVFRVGHAVFETNYLAP